MRIEYLIAGVLAVWRITHLFTHEDGPGRVFAKLREFAGHGFWGQLLDCFYCASLWAAVPFALLLGSDWTHRGLLWPALSAAAILLERWNTGRQFKRFYAEDLEDENVLR